MDAFFGLDSSREVTLPDFLAPLTTLLVDAPRSIVRDGELQVAHFLLLDELLTLLVYLRLECHTVIYDNRLLDDEILLLELAPVLLEQSEATSHSLHVLHRHAELKVVDKEADFVGTIDSVLPCRFFALALVLFVR